MSSVNDIGAFIAVVGPSGAGKDTIIDGAHKVLASKPRFRFVRRIITRKPLHENNDKLSEQEFLRQRQQGRFCLDWFAHGIYYALPKSCVEEVKAGRIVIANISRDTIKLAATLFDNLTVVEINAPIEILNQRLTARKREKAIDIQERLQRASVTIRLPENVNYQYIDNSKDIDSAVQRFLEVLRNVEKNLYS